MSRFWHWPDKIIRKRESRRLREDHNKLAQEHADMLAALELCVEETAPGEDCPLPADRYNVVCAVIARARGEG